MGERIHPLFGGFETYLQDKTLLPLMGKISKIEIYFINLKSLTHLGMSFSILASTPNKLITYMLPINENLHINNTQAK